jgi:ABC-type enterochelin transport system substrate-binding protein
MIDPSRARRIIAGAAASVFAVAAAAGMAAGVTAGAMVAGSAAAGPGVRAGSVTAHRCFAATPVRATLASSAHGRQVSYVLTAARQPDRARPRCFHA